MTLSARIVSDSSSIDKQDWEGLNHADNPFLSLAFLGGLESSGSIGSHMGWQPHHLALYEDGKLAAFAPSYIKTNSHGEFVFDWAWADAYHRHGLSYYPKLLTAVPYSPISGARLLTRQGHPREEELRRRLIRFAMDECEHQGFSSWHCNFISSDDHKTLSKSALLSRSDWQFHWRNNGYASFDDFLSRLRSRKRKNIRRERRLVAEAGHILLEGTPANIDIEEIKKDIAANVAGVIDIRHVHVWSLTQQKPLITLHADIAGDADKEETVFLIRSRIGERFQIEHATIETNCIA